jgi:transposase
VKTRLRCYDSSVDSLEESMRRFVEESDRGQWTLLPECLDDFIDESNPVRVIEAFIDALDLAEMSFEGVMPAATGRPSYHPSVLLKLYIYGYLNRVQSSRRLEREAGRNVEVMWLLGRLAPDHKTIADFRKDNGLALRRVCARFVELCREMGLLATASVAIDGSKFKAVNNRDRNFTKAKVQRRRAQLEESVARYMSQLDTADRQEPTEALAAKVTKLKEKLTKLKEEMGKLVVYEKQMLSSPDQQISLTDPDSRSMATSGRGSGVVGYNVQVAVDTEHHLIVTHEVTNSGSDRAQLANMAKQAKAVLGTETLGAVADRGYFSGPEILACHEAGIIVTLPNRRRRAPRRTDALASRTLSICRSKTPIAVPLGSNCHIASRARKTARGYGATGLQPVRIARSNHNARRGLSGGFHGGSMSICSKRCSGALMQTHKRCASVERRSSIRSGR